MFNKLIILLSVSMIVSCASKSLDTRETKLQKEPISPTFEWSEYVDSTICFPLSNPTADSIVLYYINNSAPEILRKNKLLIWNNGSVKETQLAPEFVYYHKLQGNHFLFIDYRSKFVTCSEISFSESTCQSSTSNIVNYNGDDCKEIAGLENELGVKVMRLKIALYDFCLDKKTEEQKTYTIKY